jgi:hypothetical protein
MIMVICTISTTTITITTVITITTTISTTITDCDLKQPATPPHLVLLQRIPADERRQVTPVQIVQKVLRE